MRVAVPARIRMGSMAALPAVPARIRMSGVEGAIWPTTGDIDTETNSLAISIQQLGNDIFNSNVSASVAGWQPFQDAWNAFVADFDQWQNAGWFWNPTRRDELLDYRARFNALLSQMQGLGIATNATPLASTAPPDELDKVLAILDKIVIVGAVAGVGYVGWRVYKAVAK